MKYADPIAVAFSLTVDAKGTPSAISVFAVEMVAFEVKSSPDLKTLSWLLVPEPE
jgi:hypothetical protein